MSLDPQTIKNIRENYDTLKAHFEGKNSNTVNYGDMIYERFYGFSIIQLVTINGTISITSVQFTEYEKNKDMYNSKLYEVLE